jgi:DNA-binding CsgD family transcriptional regulator
MDTGRDNIPWIKIHEFLIDCGGVRRPKEFAENVVKKIDRLIPFDQARIYYADDNENVYDEYLLNVNKKWSNLWREYYSTVENGRYSLFIHMNKQGASSFMPRAEDCVRDHTVAPADEYITDYLRPQGLKYSFGFALFDAYDALKCGISLDRTSSVRFTDREIDIMRYIQSHIDNLHRNLYVVTPPCKTGEINANTPLTQREYEIAELIRIGVGTEAISRKLFLSKKTVYRHIANIFLKMNVSSRQELMIKLGEYTVRY